MRWKKLVGLLVGAAVAVLTWLSVELQSGDVDGYRLLAVASGSLAAALGRWVGPRVIVKGRRKAEPDAPES